MALRGRRSLTFVAIAAITAGLAACRAPIVQAACEGALQSGTTGILSDPALVEVSGIGVSARNASTLWAHNDSGDGPRLFAVSTAGPTRVVYTLSGASANDWEALAIGPGPVAGRTYLYAGDIGDNGSSRSTISVYRVAEPTVAGSGAQTLTGVERLNLRYPDSPRDAEAMFVDPRSGELYVVQKSGGGGPVGIYRAPANLAAGSTTTMTRVGTVVLPMGGSHSVTAADITADGNAIAIRTYGAVRLYSRMDQSVVGALESGPCSGPIPAESQGETVAFRPDGRAYMTVSEGRAVAMRQFSMP